MESGTAITMVTSCKAVMVAMEYLQKVRI